MRLIPLVLSCALASALGCSTAPAPTAAPAASAETTSPKDSPLAYKVLQDDTNKSANTIEFHVLVADGSKHDEVEGLLKFLYRHLMQRADPPPAGVSAFVYSNESQYKTPPRSPVASMIQKPGDVGPAFENKVALEFWQQIDQALEHSDKGFKLEKKVERDDKAKTLTLTQPYTEPGKDAYADQLSFNMAMNVFTDAAQSLFEKVGDLTAMTFVGRWKDEDVVKITIDRPSYQSLKINEIDEQIGQLHGRAFLELATGHSSDAQAAKANAQRLGAVYKKMLAGLKGHATVSPKLK